MRDATFQQIAGEHRARWPLMEPQDYGKLAYQSEMGPEHAVSDPALALEEILAECRALPPDAPRRLPEAIGNGLCRFHLSPLHLSQEGLLPVLAMLFTATARRHRGTRQGLEARLAGLEGERAALEQNLSELERLREDLSGDTQARLAMIAQFEEKNQQLAQQVAQAERQLQDLRQGSQSQNDAIRQLNEERLALEGQRNQAGKDAREKADQLMRLQGEVSALDNKRMAAAMEEKQLLDRLWETYELSHEAAKAQRLEIESIPRAQRRIAELKRSISALGSINPDAVEEFQRVNERYTYFTDQRDDVTRAKGELADIIAGITREMTEIFQEQFAKINETFQEIFVELFRGGLRLTDAGRLENWAQGRKQPV